jgi:Arc/MetJ-type ribon-helix-helix transcriptional regulator
MQDRPQTKGTSIRITEQDDQAISRIIQSGWARNRSAAVSYALRMTVEQLEERAEQTA